uniref:Uncharacterized protein n=1 Tax=Schizaphis graminum TaxID=13262 RepID=A0A2S2NYB1_SCHGA
MSVALFSSAMKLPQDSVQTGGKLNKPQELVNTAGDDSDDSYEESEDNLGTLNLDGWTSFVGSSDDIAKILNMRLCLTLAYREFLKNKMISQHSSFSSVVQSVVKILSIEDNAIGLEAPDDVGKRPKENSNKGRHSKNNDSSSFSSFRKYPYGQHSQNKSYTDSSSSFRTSRNSYNMPNNRGTSNRHYQQNYSTPSTSQVNNNYKW